MIDIETLRINYDKDGWEKITEGFTKHNVVAGSILAINALCDEVEMLRQQLAEAKKDAERNQLIVDAAKNLVKVKGRYQSEVAMKLLIAAMRGEGE